MAKAFTFTSDFSSSAGWDLSGANAQITGGQLKLTPSSSYHYAASASTYDLSDSEFSVQFVQDANHGNGTISVSFGVWVDNDGNGFLFEIQNGTLGLYKKVAGSILYVAQFTYEPDVHKYLKLREAAGTIYWQVSTDGTSWASYASQAAPFDVTDCSVYLASGFYGTEPTPGFALFDNLNPGGGIPKTETFTDDFSTDAGQWANLDTRVRVEGGVLVWDSVDYYPPVTSTDIFKLTGSYLAVELAETDTAPSSTMRFGVTIDSANEVFFSLSPDYLSFTEVVAGVTSSTTVVFNRYRHKWLRLREDGGTLYWETSMDGANWVVRRSKTTTVDVTRLKARFVVGYYEPSDTGLTDIVIDNFGLPDLSLAPSLGWRTGSAGWGATDGGTVSQRAFYRRADWVWTPIPDDPVLDPNSAAIVAKLAEAGKHHSAGTYDFGVTYVYPSQITPSTPRYTIHLSKFGDGPDDYGTHSQLEGMSVPWPEGTIIPGYWNYPDYDGHVTILDAAAGLVYSLWQATFDGTNLGASWGAVTELHGDGREIGGSSTGSQLGRPAGVVRVNEMAAGEIPHALFFATDMATPDVFRYPANKTDGSNLIGSPVTIDEGTRVQLDPTLDLESIPGITPAELAIGRALQRYGAYCGDNGGARMGFLMEFAPDATDSENVGQVYEAAGIGWDYWDMLHLPWSSLRVLRNWDGS